MVLIDQEGKLPETLRTDTDEPAIKRSFDPGVDAATRVLILGSLPGERSLAEARYYAHPRNQFWDLIGSVIGTDLAGLHYGARLKRLLDAHVGLWDVVESASRHGSLDSAIRNHQPNDLRALVARLPELKAIAFNGATAGRIGRNQLGVPDGIQLLQLPSSSPAHTRPFLQKRELWMGLKEWLNDPAPVRPE